MPSFNSYSEDGRTLMIKFTCQRCKKEHIDPLKLHENDGGKEGTYGWLHYIKPPSGWEDLLHGPLLCRACVEAYKQFMNPKIVRREENPRE